MDWHQHFPYLEETGRYGCMKKGSEKCETFFRAFFVWNDSISKGSSLHMMQGMCCYAADPCSTHALYLRLKR